MAESSVEFVYILWQVSRSIAPPILPVFPGIEFLVFLKNLCKICSNFFFPLLLSVSRLIRLSSWRFVYDSAHCPHVVMTEGGGGESRVYGGAGGGEHAAPLARSERANTKSNNEN